jgi:predicted glycoside hydrolase/deacetylase ChbG (UPF0249 family)
MKKLIINADDFGLSPSVNDAIVQVWKCGNLTSTTMMVNMPGTTHAVETAKKNSALSVGLHFCITEGTALSGASTLTDERGNFHTRMELLKKIFRRQVKSEDVFNEFILQLGKFRDFGLSLSHIDSHQHIHMNPFVFGSILPAINEQKFPLRLVYPSIYIPLLFSRPKKFLKQLVMNRASKRFSAILSSPHNSGFISIHDLANPDNVEPQSYHDLLSGAGAKSDSVVELMVHPYILGDDVLEIYKGNSEKNSFLQKCASEFTVLTSAPLFSDSGFSLTSYDRL